LPIVLGYAKLNLMCVEMSTGAVLG
jgi:hypothetical protein